MFIVYFFIAIAVSYVLFAYWYSIQQKKTKEAVASITLDAEKDLIERNVSSFSRSNRELLNELLGFNTIDAYTLGEIQYLHNDEMSQAEKLASFGMNKLGSTFFYDYLMIKDSSLFLFDSELKQYVFISEINATILSVEEIAVEPNALKLNRYLPFALKRYCVVAKLNEKTSIQLRFYNCQNYTLYTPEEGVQGILKLIKGFGEEEKTNYVMGNYFIKKLNDNCTSFPISNCFD